MVHVADWRLQNVASRQRNPVLYNSHAYILGAKRYFERDVRWSK